MSTCKGESKAGNSFGHDQMVDQGDGDDDGDDYDDDWSKLALQDDDRTSYGFEDRDDNDNSNDVDDPGDGAEQHVAEAFEKGRGAAHPRGRYSYSYLKVA